MNALLHKLEFWALSVPALAGTIIAAAHYGAWRVLWAIPASFVVATLLRIGRGLLAESLNEPRGDACTAGKWARLYALTMLMALYDWFAVAVLADFAYLLIVWRYHAAMPLPFVYLIVYAASFAMPSLTRAMQNRTDGGYGMIMVEAERAMLLLAIPAAAFFPLTPVWFLAWSLVFGAVAVGWVGTLWYRAEKLRLAKVLEAEMRGQTFSWSGSTRLFPRPGVIYEPAEKPDSVLAERLANGDWEMMRKAFTVYSVSPAAFVSLALLLGGAAVLIDRGRGLVLFAFAAALVLWFFHSAFTQNEKWDKLIPSLANSAPHSFAFFALASLAVWLGTGDLVLQLATAAFLVGCFEFPTRHIIRASSWGRPDGLRFLCTLAAVAIAIALRRTFNAPWWACGICATLAAYPLVLAHYFRPPKPLSCPEEANTPQPDAVSGDPGKKGRRDRKRERQMEAFRRSKRG